MNIVPMKPDKSLSKRLLEGLGVVIGLLICLAFAVFLIALVVHLVRWI